MTGRTVRAQPSSHPVLSSAADRTLPMSASRSPLLGVDSPNRQGLSIPWCRLVYERETNLLDGRSGTASNRFGPRLHPWLRFHNSQPSGSSMLVRLPRRQRLSGSRPMSHTQRHRVDGSSRGCDRCRAWSATMLRRVTIEHLPHRPWPEVGSRGGLDGWGVLKTIGDDKHPVYSEDRQARFGHSRMAREGRGGRRRSEG